MDGVRSTDDQLLAQLLAPPDVRVGVESLGYWRARQRRLPRYRVIARREAARKVVIWERRVRNAVLQQRGVPIAERLAGARLVASTRLARWGRRIAVGFAAMIASMVLASALLVTYVLSHVA